MITRNGNLLYGPCFNFYRPSEFDKKNMFVSEKFTNVNKIVYGCDNYYLLCGDDIYINYTLSNDNFYKIADNIKFVNIVSNYSNVYALCVSNKLYTINTGVIDLVIDRSCYNIINIYATFYSALIIETSDNKYYVKSESGFIYIGEYDAIFFYNSFPMLKLIVLYDNKITVVHDGLSLLDEVTFDIDVNLLCKIPKGSHIVFYDTDNNIFINDYDQMEQNTKIILCNSTISWFNCVTVCYNTGNVYGKKNRDLSSGHIIPLLKDCVFNKLSNVPTHTKNARSN